MKTLAKIKVMPEEDAALMEKGILCKLLFEITTTKQDVVEKKTKHDILALLELMREHLPEKLHKWLHFCATSYDIINTAYAFQAKVFFEEAFIPEIKALDELWREKIRANANVIQLGRTHLQTALPVTVGFWLTSSHNRFIKNSRKALILAGEIPGCFSGAVGTFASQRIFLKSEKGEKVLMKMLGLSAAEVSTQITPPEGMARFYYELVLISAAIANLGEDVRKLQAPEYGEVKSYGSTSSTMSHKDSNPILAEKIAGMLVSVIAENSKITMTLVSDFQRDLRWSNVMRGYSAVAVYTFEQILTAKRLLESIEINDEGCRNNFQERGKLVTAEALHLFLQREGIPDAHQLVNKKIVPTAREKGINLYEATQLLVGSEEHLTDEITGKIMYDESGIIKYLLSSEKYLGDAVKIAKREAENKL